MCRLLKLKRMGNILIIAMTVCTVSCLMCIGKSIQYSKRIQCIKNESLYINGLLLGYYQSKVSFFNSFAVLFFLVEIFFVVMLLNYLKII